MIETRKATFRGHPYQFLAHDTESVLATSGVKDLPGLIDRPADAVYATWWTFEDESAVRERHWHFSPGDVVLDIGAAFGSYTLTAAVQGARVYACEPSEFMRVILERNIAANPDIEGRITVLPIGVSESHGTLPDGLHVESLDGLVSMLALGKLDMIKMDVEGAELGALRSGERTLRRFKPRMLIENHEHLQSGIGTECERVVLGYGLHYAKTTVPYGSVTHTYYEPQVSA